MKRRSIRLTKVTPQSCLDFFLKWVLLILFQHRDVKAKTWDLVSISPLWRGCGNNTLEEQELISRSLNTLQSSSSVHRLLVSPERPQKSANISYAFSVRLPSKCDALFFHKKKCGYVKEKNLSLKILPKWEFPSSCRIDFKFPRCHFFMNPLKWEGGRIK